MKVRYEVDIDRNRLMAGQPSIRMKGPRTLGQYAYSEKLLFEHGLKSVRFVTSGTHVYAIVECEE